MRQNEKETAKTKRPPVQKIFLIGMGTAVLGFGLYELYKRMTGQVAPTEDTSTLLEAAAVKTSKTAVVRNDRFPLKKGSLGNNVRLMQAGLQKILGVEAFSKLTPIDGNYESGTEQALVQAGFPKTVDEPTFLTILQGNAAADSTASFDPVIIARQLYNQVFSKNLNGVLMSLKQLKSVGDYALVNPEYKKLTKQETDTTYTLVTHLLNYSGFDGVSKEKIREEFRRMGLIEKSNGSWSLSGIRIYKDIQTLVHTFVTEATGMTILVDKGTILGEELKVSNGMTSFKALDGRLYKVPTRDVAQVR